MNKQELLNELNLARDSYSNENGFRSGVRTGLGIALGVIVKLDEPEKVEPLVVPKYLGEWLDSKKIGVSESFFTIIDDLRFFWDEIEKYGPLYNFIIDNKKELIEVILGNRGYEIEKEKLYRVEMHGTDGLLLTLEISGYYFEEHLDYVGERPNVKQEFTESEIKAIDERYWQFAVEVAE